MSKEAKLGLFVLVVFAVFLFFTVNMGSGLFAGQKRTYPVRFKTIGTLEKGAPVKQAGFDVGEVISISPQTVMEPTPTHYVVVEASVNNNAHIAYDSKASILTMGMMGEKYIEISFGKLEDAPEGTTIDGEGAQPLDEVMSVASDAIKEIQKLVESVNLIFADEKFQKDITQLVTNLEQITKGVNDLIGNQEERLKNILINTQAASANLTTLIASAELFVADARGLINDNRPVIKSTFENTSEITKALRKELPGSIEKMGNQLTALSEQLSQTMKNTDQVLVKLDGIIGDNRSDIRDTINSIKDFSANAKSASQRVDDIIKQINEGDGLAHNLIYDATLSKSAKGAITHASSVLGNVSDLRSRFSFDLDTRYYTDEPRFDPHDNNARVDFGVRYALSDKMNVYLGGNSLGTANQFEGQVGYKLGPVTFHGGMIESEFGLGLDWQILDRWMVGVEGVGLTDEDEERLDAYTEFLLWKRLYLVGGVQDITDERFPNVGVKLRF